jgi:hypothetical protein
MFMKRNILGIAALVGLVGVGAIAQVPPVWPSITQGETNVFTWEQPVSCGNPPVAGTTLADCPITGYYVQIARATLPDVFTNISTSPVSATTRQYIWTANGLGETCFRVQVLNGSGYEQSPPSNVKCLIVKAALKKGSTSPVLSSQRNL